MNNSRLSVLLSLMVLIILTLLAYIPALGAYFHEDDWGHLAFVTDPANSPWALGGWFYRPLFLELFSLFHKAFKLNALLWHASTIVLHLVNTTLVYALIRRLKFNITSACIGAAVFGVYPTNVNAVTWLCAVSGVMATLFSLTAVHITLTNRLHIITRILLCSVAWTAALLSKEDAACMILILPVLPILAGVVRGKKDILLWIGSCIILPVILYGFITIESHCNITLGNTGTRLDPTTLRCSAVFASWLIRESFWPGVLSTVFTAALAALIPISAWVRYPGIRPGLYWFFASAIAIGIALAGIAPAERYGYIPSIGIAICAAGLVNHFTSRKKKLDFVDWFLSGTFIICLASMRYSPLVWVLVAASAAFYWLQSHPSSGKDTAAMIITTAALLYRGMEYLSMNLGYGSFPLWTMVSVPFLLITIVVIVNRGGESVLGYAGLVLLTLLVFWIKQPFFTWFLFIMTLAEFIRTGLTRPANDKTPLKPLVIVPGVAVISTFIACLTLGTYNTNIGWYRRGLDTRKIVTKTAATLHSYPRDAEVIIQTNGARIAEPRIFDVTARIIARRPDLHLTINNNSGGSGGITIKHNKQNDGETDINQARSQNK